MEKCESCWMRDYKNTKDRQMTCSACELNYHINQLGETLANTKLMRGLFGIYNKIGNTIVEVIKRN